MLLIILSTRNSSLFLINDDVLIDHILSGRTFNVQGDVPPFISFILSKFINVLYAIFGTKLSIYGIFLYIINLFISLILLNIIIKSKYLIQIGLGSFLLIVLYPVLFYSPTFTITAFLAIGIGIIGLYIYLVQGGRNYLLISLLNMIIISGILVRPQAFFGYLVFFGPLIVYKIIKSERFTKIIFSFSFSLIAFIFLLDKFLKTIFLNKSPDYLNYFKFIELRAELSFTNAIFKAQQLIIDNSIPNSPFKSIDFLLLLNWFNLDKSKFNFVNFNYVIDFVDEYKGINAIFNTNILDNIERLIIETSSLNKFWILFILFFVTFMGKNYFKLNILILGILFISFFSGFYFLSAAGRLPYRTIFPVAILLLSSLFVIQELTNKKPKNYISFIVICVLVLFSFDFHFSNYFGFKQIYKSNIDSLNFYQKREKELSIFLGDKNVIIAPIDVLPMSIQGTTYRNISWNSSNNSISIDWTAGSPSWNLKAHRLGINHENVFNSLSKTKNFYYAGTSDSAHILEDYMIQNNIKIGKLCSIANLNGLDVFTYQAKVNDC